MKNIFIIILILTFIYCEKIELKEAKTMAQQTINIGSAYDDPDADKKRDAFDKCNDNFTELYGDVASLQANNSVNEVLVVLPIGAWNMDSSSDMTVAWSKPTNAVITHVDAMILSDDGKIKRSICYLGAGGASYDSDEAGIYIERAASSGYDSAAYDDAVMNRGHVVIRYYIP